MLRRQARARPVKRSERRHVAPWQQPWNHSFLATYSHRVRRVCAINPALIPIAYSVGGETAFRLRESASVRQRGLNEGSEEPEVAADGRGDRQRSLDGSSG